MEWSSLELEIKEPRSAPPVKPRCHCRGLGQPGGDSQASIITSGRRDGHTSALTARGSRCLGPPRAQSRGRDRSARVPHATQLLLGPSQVVSCPRELGRSPPPSLCPRLPISSAPTGSSSRGVPRLPQALKSRNGHPQPLSAPLCCLGCDPELRQLQGSLRQPGSTIAPCCCRSSPGPAALRMEHSGSVLLIPNLSQTHPKSVPGSSRHSPRPAGSVRAVAPRKEQRGQGDSQGKDRVTLTGERHLPMQPLHPSQPLPGKFSRSNCKTLWCITRSQRCY